MRQQGKILRIVTTAGAAGLVFAVALVCGCSPSTPLPPPAAKSTNTFGGAKTNSLQSAQSGTNDNILATKSIFDDKLKNGRDPFFPNSARREAVKTVATAAPVAKAPPSPESVLMLNSIIGSASMRIASINGRTFSLGEEKTIKTTNGDFRVRCLEIGAQSVTVTVDGRPERKTIVLKK